MFLGLVLITNLALFKFLKDINLNTHTKSITRNDDNSDAEMILLRQFLENIDEGIIAISSSNKILFQNVKLSRLLMNNKTNYDSALDLPEGLLVAIKKSSTSLESSIALEFIYNNTKFSLTIIPNIKSHTVESSLVILKDVTLDTKIDKLKTDLVTNISHELKTPLTSIQGYSELLLDSSKSLSELDIKYLNKILNNSKKLISIYDSLLSLSNIEDSNDLTKETLIFEDLILQSFEKLKSKYSKSSTQLNINLDYKEIKVNPDLFETAIINIMENSFKYSNEDLIISVSLQAEGHSFVIKFTDNGIGISKDKNDKIFQRFYRINESRSDDIKGLGLGLSLVKNIIEKHSGSVQVGDIDTGAQIILIIPR